MADWSEGAIRQLGGFSGRTPNGRTFAELKRGPPFLNSSIIREDDVSYWHL